MIYENKGIVHVNTLRTPSDWGIMVVNKLLVLAAAAGNPDNGPGVNAAISAELFELEHYLPSEVQMSLALSISPDAHPSLGEHRSDQQQ